MIFASLFSVFFDFYAQKPVYQCIIFFFKKKSNRMCFVTTCLFLEGFRNPLAPEGDYSVLKVGMFVHNSSPVGG